MKGETLVAIRDRIQTLSSAGGDYVVVCGRTGERPVPVDEHEFPTRKTAAEAAQTAAAYRAVLRQYDPYTPVYDFIVCEVPDEGTAAVVSAGATDTTPREGPEGST